MSISTIYREIKRNSTAKGHYLWDKAQAKADARKKRSTSNSCKEPELIWEALFYLEEYQWSPKQISGHMRKNGKSISHECIYQHVRGNEGLEKHCRHKMKYNRHGRKERTTRVKNIPNRISIHDRPVEANGKRFGDWEMDTIIGKDGKGAILTLTERSTNFLIACKLKHGKNAHECAKAAVAQLFAYRDQVHTITTDNGSEFCAHESITAKLRRLSTLQTLTLHGRKGLSRMQTSCCGSIYRKVLTSALLQTVSSKIKSNSSTRDQEKNWISITLKIVSSDIFTKFALAS